MCLLGELIDKYEKKLFSRVEGWKLQGGKNNPVYSTYSTISYWALSKFSRPAMLWPNYSLNVHNQIILQIGHILHITFEHEQLHK